MTLLDGEHLLAAYLAAGGTPHTLVRAESFDGARLAAFAQGCRQAKTVVVPDALFAELAPVATPTGVLAEAAWLTPQASADLPLVVVLEDIQDPGNLGAMLRTAAAAGATLAVLSKGCHDAWSPKALRGGQGAQFVLPMQLAADLGSWLRDFSGTSVALAPEAAHDLFVLDYTGATALVVGNEGAGLSAATLAAATTRARIPMPGRVESLNASAALAVAVFEALRQRGVRR